MNPYHSTNRSKHYLKCHIIFVCKYRKKLLVGEVKDRIKEKILEVSERSDFSIEVMESDNDHIHMLIRYKPRIAVTSIARRLKQETTVDVWRHHSDLLRRHFWKEKTFWSDGYFVCSIGEASSSTIRDYILSQG